MAHASTEAAISSLVSGPYVKACEAVTGGPSHFDPKEHEHAEVQITVVAESSRLLAEWHSETGNKYSKQVLGGEICVTPAWQSHSMDWSEAGGSLMLWISRELCSHDIEMDCSRTEEVRCRYGVTDPFLWELTTLLKRAARASVPVTRLEAESLAILLLKHLLCEEKGIDDPRTVKTAALRCLNQVIEYIHANIESDLSISALARIANVSPFHFARQFKMCTGFAPHEYVRRQRLERAKRLLERSDLSIADVAYGCGFANQAHMSTAFRRVVGMAPKAYRAYSAR
jgi:AraC family transcriptional regulator